MLKIFFQKILSLRAEFSRYFIVGISGLVVDMGTLWLFVDKFHWAAILSLILNQFIVLTFVFYLNKLWAFKSQGQTRKEARRYIILYCFNYIIAIFWMWLWHNRLGLEPKLVRLANIALSVSWNFPLYKYFVYSPKSAPVNNLAK